MGNQIIKQPNGKYCIFSSVVDSVTDYDMTKDEIVDQWVSEAKERIEKDVADILNKLEIGGKPYYQFTKSFDEMLELIKDIHGDEEFNDVKKCIEGNG